MFRDWLLLYAKICSKELQKSQCHCPQCGAQTIDLEHVGDVVSRVAFLSMWCNTCLYGIHGSRVRVPENQPMLSSKEPMETITSRIPEFKEVYPE
jgi:hypothetical protein